MNDTDTEVTQYSGKPEHRAFAERLRQALAQKGWSASDLAREMFGTTKNERGNDVAKGRARIGNYLAGTSYPAEQQTVDMLAAILDVPPGELTIARPAWRERTDLMLRRATGDLIMADPERAHILHLEINRDLPWKLAMKIFQMVKEAEMGDDADADADKPDTE